MRENLLACDEQGFDESNCFGSQDSVGIRDSDEDLVLVSPWESDRVLNVVSNAAGVQRPIFALIGNQVDLCT